MHRHDFQGENTMTELINNYTRSCFLVKQRITELTAMKNGLMKSGNELKVKELDLDRRIHLLYVEQAEMQEVIAHLSSYKRGQANSVEA